MWLLWESLESTRCCHPLGTKWFLGSYMISYLFSQQQILIGHLFCATHTLPPQVLSSKIFICGSNLAYVRGAVCSSAMVMSFEEFVSAETLANQSPKWFHRSHHHNPPSIPSFWALANSSSPINANVSSPTSFSCFFFWESTAPPAPCGRLLSTLSFSESRSARDYNTSSFCPWKILKTD